MYRLLATIILFFCTLNAAAFSLGSANNKALVERRSIRRSQRLLQDSAAQLSIMHSSTALNLRVKVDPNEKTERLNPAVFKNALYLGSIVLAVVLPVALLVVGSR